MWIKEEAETAALREAQDTEDFPDIETASTATGTTSAPRRSAPSRATSPINPYVQGEQTREEISERESTWLEEQRQLGHGYGPIRGFACRQPSVPPPPGMLAGRRVDRYPARNTGLRPHTAASIEIEGVTVAVCKRYNDARGCRQPCPLGLAHVCDGVLSDNLGVCGDDAHGRLQHCDSEAAWGCLAWTEKS